jgi:outer membrane immunogenic protein
MIIFMKKLVFAASILATSTACASAADLAVKAPPMVPAVFSWTGGYGGIAGGYGWGHSDQTDPGIPTPPIPTFNPGLGDGHFSTNGGLLGGTLGYNWQKGPWVYGVEGDFSWADIKGQSSVCGPTTVTPHPCGTSLDALGTFRGRVGYAAGATGNWLLYATGGLAIGDVRGWDALMPASGNDWRAGWTVGAGVEAAIAPNWTAKLEYLHVDLGNGQVFNIVPGIAESVSFKADIVRAGINYKFGGGAVSAYAADLPPGRYTMAPVMAPGNPWSGWYAGLNMGYVDGSTGINSTALITSASNFPGNTAAMAAGANQQLSTGQGGFLGGAQVGYNYLISPTLLTGLEADIQGSSLRGNASATSVASTIPGSLFFNDTVTTNIATSRSLDYIGTIRAKLGALVTPSTLLYVTGGLAYGGVKSSTSVTQAFATFVSPFPPSPPASVNTGSFSDTRAGYTVGAGGEWMFLSNWSAKLEYLYYDLGSANYGTGISAFDAGSTSNGFGIDSIATSSRVHFNGNIVRAGVNYHLN